MNIKLNAFPGGVTRALTLSYDDGRDHDRRLVEIMNRYHIKGSFHLNSGFFGRDGYITAEEVSALFAEHEISAHTCTHPFLETIPEIGVIKQIVDDRAALEQLANYPVRGMSYPNGTYNEKVIGLLPALGIEYARTVQSHGKFTLPDNWLEWHPTCHHNDMLRVGEQFLQPQRYDHMQLLYVWGHSYEFHNDNNWETIEQFCQMIGGRNDIWYATNIEIVDYINAMRQLRFSAAQTIVYNPSSLDIWISADGVMRKIGAGQTVNLTE
ncbi:polysaccharide deacetylase family protein [Paenibacillus sp. GCM10027626]|uniref:polysaccharide deacetylase family protein n=1 Tax=Paenibacillus sp. GCM10027626 TaxID=3273411 RepID=UPI003635CD25